MGIAVIAEFIAKATVRVVAYIYNDADALVDPTSIKVIIKDPDGVQKAGYISVSDSSSFTAGLTVTGTTSGATGYVISKPDGTTLELQRVTGAWESGEAITDTGAGSSTTTSALLGATMTQQDSATGIYGYYYHTTTSSATGWWQGEVVVVDGSSTTAKTSVGTFSFRVK